MNTERKINILTLLKNNLNRQRNQKNSTSHSIIEMYNNLLIRLFVCLRVRPFVLSQDKNKDYYFYSFYINSFLISRR